MSNSLYVSCIQADLVWENKEANLNLFENIINNLPRDSEIVILPEMFTTGFTMNSEKLAEPFQGDSYTWMAKQAALSGKIIIGSFIIREKENNYNRLVAMFPDGNYYTYDKRHLFRMGKENEHYKKGEKRLVFKFKDWNICPLVCYDLRFPVWSRNRNDYDVLIYIANWPKPRSEVWKSLLIARAIENQAYVIGVNRVGSDGEGLYYSGDSMIINPKGQIISLAKENKQDVIHARLSLDDLNEFKSKFPVYLDADDFEILK